MTTPTPFLRPIRVAELSFPRQTVLLNEIQKNRLWQIVEEETMTDSTVHGWWTSLRLRIRSIPPGFHPVLDTVNELLRVRLRLNKPLLFLTGEYSDNYRLAVAFEVDGQLEVFISPEILNSGASEIAYHVGLAIWLAWNHKIRLVRGILGQPSPVEIDIRLMGFEVLRLLNYSAACFGLLCCQNREAALSVCLDHPNGWRLSPDREYDFGALLSQYRKSGELNTEKLLRLGQSEFDLLPVIPHLLDRFYETRLFDELTGNTGSTLDWCELCSEIQDLDLEVHHRMEQLPTDMTVFGNLAIVLSYAVLLEEAGHLESTDEREFQELVDMEDEEWSGLNSAYGSGLLSNPGQNLKQILAGPLAPVAKATVVEILSQAVDAIALRFGKIPSESQTAFYQIADWCQIPIEQSAAIVRLWREQSENNRKPESGDHPDVS